MHRGDAPASQVGGGRRLRALSARWISRALPFAQLTPAFLTLLFCMFLPIAAFVVYSFWKVANYDMVPVWNLDNYTRIVGGSTYLRVLFNTIVTGLIVAIASTAVAYGFAHALRFQLARHQTRLLLLVLVAMFSGYLVRIFAWRTLLGDQGIINTLLTQLGLIDQPLTFLLYNRFATILVLCGFLVPLAVLPIYAALQNVRDAEVEAARDLGCDAWKAFTLVTLPLAWPGVFTAFSLVFILASGDYTTPTLVGGTDGAMIGQTIGQTFLSQFDWPLGAALAMVTLGLVLACIGVLRWGSGKIVK